MNPRRRLGTAAGRAALLLALMLPALAHLSARGQSPAAAASQPAVTLSDQQRVVRDRMARLEDKMFQLSQVLRSTDPQNADRLLHAFQEARARLVQANMERVAAMLDERRWSDAGPVQQALVADLERVLKVLLEEHADFDSNKEQLELLQRLRAQLDSLLDEQRREQQAALEAANAAANLHALQAAATRIASLLQRQQAAAQRNADAATEPPDSARAAASEQAAIRRDTADLLRAMHAARPATPSATADTRDDTHAPPIPEAAAQPLRQADEPMRQAQSSLQQGQRAAARPQQEQAAARLRDALQRLEREIEETSRELGLPEQAREQQATRDKTQALSDQMAGPRSPGQPAQPTPAPGDPPAADSNRGAGTPTPPRASPPSGSSPPNATPPAPGQRSVEQAVPYQQESADALEQADPRRAAENQQKAIDKLEEARRQLDDALQQLRREQKEELLAALEARFSAMLARQKDVNCVTDRLSAADRATWSRADQLELAEAAEQQQWVADEAQKIVHILKEEGTTVVFPEIVETVRQDGAEVAARLTTADTGPAVRATQQSLVESLEQLLAAVAEQREQNEDSESESGQGGEQSSNPPLLPGSAELKLLRSSQLRVNHLTRILEDARRAAPPPDAEALRRDLDRAAQRQAEVFNLAQSLRDARAQPENAQDAPGP